MRIHTFHNRSLVAGILILFACTTAGFTSAMRSCSMGGIRQCSCEDMDLDRAIQGHVLTDGTSCCTIHLAGGLNPVPTTLSTTDQTDRSPSPTTAFAALVLPELSSPTISLPGSRDFSRGAPPCASKKYVLTSTFLI